MRVLATLLISAAAFAGTPGTFRGILYPGRDTKPGWVYIVGRNDMLRLVHIGNATITYADEFPDVLRDSDPAKALKPGADVRVVADQDAKGNWHAREVQIISLRDQRGRRHSPARPDTQDRPELQTRKN